MLIIKENITSSHQVETDEADSSVTRPVKLLRQLFKSAGLVCVKETEQSNFPKGLYAVRMFALRPEQHLGTKENEFVKSSDSVVDDMKT